MYAVTLAGGTISSVRAYGGLWTAARSMTLRGGTIRYILGYSTASAKLAWS